MSLNSILRCGVAAAAVGGLLAGGCIAEFEALTETGGATTAAPATDSVNRETATGGSRCDLTPESLGDCARQDRYEEDLRFIAQPRTPTSDHWQAVQDLCFDRFSQLGYATERVNYGTGINVVGRKPGLTIPDESVVIAAHYDHIPDCAGADDNATGIAGVFESARLLMQADFDRTLVVACWDQEEIGLIGSRAFVTDAVDRGERVVANFNYEMIGFIDNTPGSQAVPAGFDALFPEAFGKVEAGDFRGDFITIVGDDLADGPASALARHADRIGLRNAWLSVPASLKRSLLLSDLRRSDHASFWDADFPAMMITDTANLRYGNYHCADGPDDMSLLDHAFSRDVIAATVSASAEVLGMQPPA